MTATTAFDGNPTGTAAPTIPLTLELMDKAAAGFITSALVAQDLPHTTTATLTDPSTSVMVEGLVVSRITVREALSMHAFQLRIPRNVQAVRDMFQQTGQTVNHPFDEDTLVSFVRWERLVPSKGPLVPTFSSKHPAQTSTLLQRHPHLALERILHPIDTQDLGQPVAIGLAYYGPPCSVRTTNTHPKNIRMLVATGPGTFNAVPLVSMPDALQQLVIEWVEYGIHAHDWNLALGADVASRIRAYVNPLTFSTEVFFFQDRAIAVADTPERTIVMGLGKTQHATTAHHAMSTAHHFQNVVAALAETTLTLDTSLPL